eukprot:1192165-Prorocentrum_minimum.AAC.2
MYPALAGGWSVGRSALSGWGPRYYYFDWLLPRARALWCDPIGYRPEHMPFGAIRLAAYWLQPRAYALWCDPIGHSP